MDPLTQLLFKIRRINPGINKFPFLNVPHVASLSEDADFIVKVILP